MFFLSNSLYDRMRYELDILLVENEAQNAGVEVLYHYGEFLKLTSSNSFKIRRENLSYLAIWVVQLPDNLQLKASESLMFMMCDQD